MLDPEVNASQDSASEDSSWYTFSMPPPSSSGPYDEFEPNNEFQRTSGWMGDPVPNDSLFLDDFSFASFVPLGERDGGEDARVIENTGFGPHPPVNASVWNPNGALDLSIPYGIGFSTTFVEQPNAGQGSNPTDSQLIGFQIPNQAITPPVSQHDGPIAQDSYQALFSSFEEALIYMQSSKHNPQAGDTKPQEDASVAQVEQKCREHVRAIYNAMVSLEDIQDVNEFTIKHFNPKDPRYEPCELEATAWAVVQATIDLHKKGRTFHRRWDKSHKILQNSQAADVSLTCAERLEEVRTLLAESKSTVETAIEGNIKFVNHPRYYRQTLRKNRRTVKTTTVAGKIGQEGNMASQHVH